MCASALSTRSLTFSVVIIGVRHVRVCYVGVGGTGGGGGGAWGLLISMKIGSHDTRCSLPVHGGWHAHTSVWIMCKASLLSQARGLCVGAIYGMESRPESDVGVSRFADRRRTFHADCAFIWG